MSGVNGSHCWVGVCYVFASFSLPALLSPRATDCPLLPVPHSPCRGNTQRRRFYASLLRSQRTQLRNDSRYSHFPYKDTVCISPPPNERSLFQRGFFVSETSTYLVRDWWRKLGVSVWPFFLMNLILKNRHFLVPKTTATFPSTLYIISN